MEGETLVCKSFEKNVANLVTEFSFLSQEKHPNIVKSVKEPKEIKFNNQYKMYVGITRVITAKHALSLSSPDFSSIFSICVYFNYFL